MSFCHESCRGVARDGASISRHLDDDLKFVPDYLLTQVAPEQAKHSTGLKLDLAPHLILTLGFISVVTRRIRVIILFYSILFLHCIALYCKFSESPITLLCFSPEIKGFQQSSAPPSPFWTCGGSGAAMKCLPG